jgi:hypothetical protein
MIKKEETAHGKKYIHFEIFICGAKDETYFTVI